MNIKKTVFSLFVLEFAYLFYHLLSKIDLFIEINELNSSKCEVMMSAIGPEDMITFNDTLIFSSFNKGF
jgi:hypothetical protein